MKTNLHFLQISQSITVRTRGKSEKGFVPEEFDYDPDETIQDFLNYVLKFTRGA